MRMKKCRFCKVSALILAVFVWMSIEAGFCLHPRAEGFSDRLSGVTGWTSTTVSLYEADQDFYQIGQIQAKEPFRILGRYGDDMLEVEYDGTVGCVETDNVLINLPDVEPDIIYNLTNATGSIFTATTERGTVNLKLSLYGTQLYYNGDASVYYDSDAYSATADSRAGKVWNPKLGKYEFIVPILFTAAEKISAARERAAADGFNFKIYDAYRTNVATQLMNSSFNSLYGEHDGRLKLAGYDTSFYVAAALSAHNIGCAIDVTMVRGTEEADMPTQMHVLSGDAVLLNYSSSGRTAHELAGKSLSYYYDNFAGTMTEDAKLLCQYMIGAGMTGLGSEWWHYQDQTGYSRNAGCYSNLATWYPCQLYAPASDTVVPEVMTRRAEAVYQLWAAAGFPAASGDISFTDVTELDYYYNAVRWAVSAGLISGSSSTTFSPNDAITRAGFLDMLYRYCGGAQADSSEAPAFSDVSPNAWYYSAVQWAAGLGFAGDPSGAFRPASVLTQEQMHSFLTGAAGAGIVLSGNYI